MRHLQRYRSGLDHWGLALRIALAVWCLPALAPDALAQSDEPRPWPPPFAGEAPSLRFRHLGLGDGLAQSSGQSIMQDRQGFLWIGTGSGLHRYDGYGFKVYAATPFDTTSISDNG